MVARKKVVVALGGNALQRPGERGSALEMRARIEEVCRGILSILDGGYLPLLTHGNGPQVGDILLKNERSKEFSPPMPLDICGAQTQGMIGYLIQQQLHNALRSHGRRELPIALCTQTLVDGKDPAFAQPSKPIGPFYSREEAERLKEEKGWKLIDQVGKGFRRVVPSPLPIDIVEIEVIKGLIEGGWIAIACGGGGIPVVREGDGALRGVEAVVDKDRSGALFGKKAGADLLLILTDVEYASIRFGTAEQRDLKRISSREARGYLEGGEFGVGSMAPKVEAACDFVEAGGEMGVITSLEDARAALDGLSGTIITN